MKISVTRGQFSLTKCWNSLTLGRPENTQIKLISAHIVVRRGHYLNHWGRVTHICISNLTITGSDNGLSPGRRQAIIWTNAGILLTGNKLQQSGTKPNLVAKIWLPTLVTICNRLPKLVANISSHIPHLVNTGLTVGSLVKWLPIKVATPAN